MRHTLYMIYIFCLLWEIQFKQFYNSETVCHRLPPMHDCQYIYIWNRSSVDLLHSCSQIGRRTTGGFSDMYDDTLRQLHRLGHDVEWERYNLYSVLPSGRPPRHCSQRRYIHSRGYTKSLYSVRSTACLIHMYDVVSDTWSTRTGGYRDRLVTVLNTHLNTFVLHEVIRT